MRVIVTGQVGVEKKSYLRAVVELAQQEGQSIDLYNVGDLMYAEAPDIAPGRILDLPLSRLHGLRRAVVRDIIFGSKGKKNIIVNTHATFRWRHGLFAAFDFDQVRQLEPDALVCLIDNVEVMHHRLHAEHTIDATLKDLMVWREEEIMATELLAQALGLGKRFFILARGRNEPTTQTAFRLVCRPSMKKAYASFPMSHVIDMPRILAEIDHFRAELARHFITFDPGDVDEKLLLDWAIDHARQGNDFLEIQAGAGASRRSISVPVKQVLDIAGDVDGQIYARDFKLIDQSDLIVSYIPQLPGPGPGGGIPGLSSGVERELHHAFEHGKEVYVVWKPAKNPSPFVTETATKLFRSTEEAMEYLRSRGK